MRLGAILNYYRRKNTKGFLLFSAIVLAAFICIVLIISPFMSTAQNQTVGIGSLDVVITQSAGGKLVLNSPFGTTGFLFYCFMLLFANTSMRADRRYLLSNNISRREFVTASFLAAALMALALCASKYVIDLCCRALTCALGFQIAGHVWDARLLIMSEDGYLNDLLITIGGLIMLAGIWSLLTVLFTRWKKACIIIIVALIVAPMVVTNFLPANWMAWIYNHMDAVLSYLRDLYNRYGWILMRGNAAWLSALIYAGIGAACYAVCYPILRRLAVRSK